MNYKQHFAIQKRLEKELTSRFAGLKHEPGIYAYYRTDEDGNKFAYVGQSVDVLQRCVQHMQGYQHIDLSLRKRGYYDAVENKHGWKINVFCCPKEDLDLFEKMFIQDWQDDGYELYNIESGGKVGKTIIGERKPAKGYRDGVEQGKKQICRELVELLDKYLVVSVKKEGKLAERALAKFNKILHEL